MECAGDYGAIRMPVAAITIRNFTAVKMFHPRIGLLVGLNPILQRGLGATLRARTKLRILPRFATGTYCWGCATVLVFCEVRHSSACCITRA